MLFPMFRSFGHIVFLLLLACTAAAQTPDALWQSLMQGNRDFVAGKVTFDHLAELRRHSAAHQNPPVTILSCSDSRVPPEIIFHRSLDQLFVIRVAGNIAAAFELASIEYAISNGYTKLIVVLGHEECGAVKAAMAPEKQARPILWKWAALAAALALGCLCLRYAEPFMQKPRVARNLAEPTAT